MRTNFLECVFSNIGIFSELAFIGIFLEYGNFSRTTFNVDIGIEIELIGPYTH